ncbi:hypothetical protein PMES_01440, partial [Profundibacterium mesophilum KAUST100406-0324]
MNALLEKTRKIDTAARSGEAAPASPTPPVPSGPPPSSGSAYPALARAYPEDFSADAVYRA